MATRNAIHQILISPYGLVIIHDAWEMSIASSSSSSSSSSSRNGCHLTNSHFLVNDLSGISPAFHQHISNISPVPLRFSLTCHLPVKSSMILTSFSLSIPYRGTYRIASNGSYRGANITQWPAKKSRFHPLGPLHGRARFAGFMPIAQRDNAVSLSLHRTLSYTISSHFAPSPPRTTKRHPIPPHSTVI